MATKLQILARKRNWDIGQVRMATFRMQQIHDSLGRYNTEVFTQMRHDYIYWIQLRYEEDKANLLLSPPIDKDAPL